MFTKSIFVFDDLIFPLLIVNSKHVPCQHYLNVYGADNEVSMKHSYPGFNKLIHKTIEILVCVEYFFHMHKMLFFVEVLKFKIFLGIYK